MSASNSMKELTVKMNPFVEDGQFLPTSDISMPPSAIPCPPLKTKASGVRACIALWMISSTSRSSVSSPCGVGATTSLRFALPRSDLADVADGGGDWGFGVPAPLSSLPSWIGVSGLGFGGTLRTSWNRRQVCSGEVPASSSRFSSARYASRRGSSAGVHVGLGGASSAPAFWYHSSRAGKVTANLRSGAQPYRRVRRKSANEGR